MRTVIVGITGASGAIYGIRLMEVLSKNKDVETHLILTRAGEVNIKAETDWEPQAVRALATFNYEINDFGARLASGSFRRDAMVVAPCTVKTMSALANCFSENLLLRAGDVTLKERKPLILLVRESPLHLGHLRNMIALTEAGAIIMPPVPAFYAKPTTIQEIVDHTVGRILDLLGLDHDLIQRWPGLKRVET